jgi:hypothetical protein
MGKNGTITRREAWERVSEALLSQLTEHIAPPTRTDRELLQAYGAGPIYQPGTRCLSGQGYHPFAEIEAGEDYCALLRAQRRSRDWQWHCERVDSWLDRFKGNKFDRAEFEEAFRRSFNAISQVSYAVDPAETLLASLPNKREPTAAVIHLPDKIPNTDQSSAAAQALKSLWPNGVPSNKRTSDVHRQVNQWIKKQPRNLAPVNEVSVETVARLLGRRGRQTGSSAGK